MNILVVEDESLVASDTVAMLIDFNHSAKSVSSGEDAIKEVKKEFIERALAQIVAAKTGNPAALLTLIDASGKSGADTIGSELQKCPHLYCQIGGAAFRVLGSIFNSSKAVSDLTQQFSGDFRETVLEKKMVEQIGSMSFK